MPQVNDNLVPVITQPLIFAELYLVTYFFVRLLIVFFKTPNRRWKRAVISLVISVIVYLLIGIQHWYIIGEKYFIYLCNPFYMLALITINILFSIWYRR